MAKRFTDTNKYRKPFIRSLQGAYKIFWDYLYHDCDHAGIWIVDFEIAQIYIGSDMPINKKDAIKYFNSNEIRIIEIDNKSKWFIPSFIDFQYGKLNENNRAHNSVIQILFKYNLYNYDKGLIRGLQAPKDKDMDKDMDKVKDKESFIVLFDKIKIEFEIPKDIEELILVWLKYKSEKRQTYKEIGLRTLIKQILIDYKTSEQFQKAIDYSMSNNYSGIFKDKNDDKSKRHDTDF